jgi:hypothetical protein
VGYQAEDRELSLYTNFNLLVDSDSDEKFLQSVELVTGARDIYGYTTPINLLDILDISGIQTAIPCLYRSTTDNRELAKAIGISWMQGHSYAYTYGLPNDNRVFDLMVYLELFLSGINDEITPRFDYCGNNITGSVITVAQLQDLENGITATVNALDEWVSPTPYALLIANNGPFPEGADDTVGGMTLDLANPYYDIINRTPTGLTGYVERPIIPLMAADPNAYLKDTLVYDPLSIVYYKATYRRGTDLIPNFSNLASKNSGEAAVIVSEQVSLDNGNMLFPVYGLLASAVNYYNTARRVAARPKVTRFQQIQIGMPGVQTLWPTEEQSAEDAALNRRAQLLQDQNYVLLFDSDGSGGLSAAERVNLEKAVQAQALIARKAVGTALYTAALADYNDAASATNSLSTILRTYLL